MILKSLMRVVCVTAVLVPLSHVEHVVAAFPAKYRAAVGQVVCGSDGFDLTDEGVHCHTCPEYTGQPGDPEGLDIDNLLHGHFSRTDARELLLDTSGCESHVNDFGGAIVLGEGTGTNLNLSFKYYRSGFRLDNCATLDLPGERTLLACSESSMAQGEVLGYVSVIDITQKGFTRWRLFRWYDNAATEADKVVSVVPENIRFVSEDAGRGVALRVNVRVVQASRKEYEKRGGDVRGDVLRLLFQRQGERFFADKKTREALAGSSDLIRNFID